MNYYTTTDGLFVCNLGLAGGLQCRSPIQWTDICEVLYQCQHLSGRDRISVSCFAILVSISQFH